MLEILAAILENGDQRKFSLSVLFILITINTLTQRSFRLKDGTYMYIICVSEMAAILNMATEEFSGDVESSQFGFTTVKNIIKLFKSDLLLHVPETRIEKQIVFQFV